MEFDSAIKKNEIKLFAGKWMELEIVMLNEIRQSHKDKYLVFLLICEI
jgi:RNase P/RNase MRP subunit p30